MLSGIIYIQKNGLQWKDAPAVYGPPKTHYNRFVRWSRMGVFVRIFAELAQPGPDGQTIMIDSTHLKAHRTAASLSKRGTRPRAIGRTKGRLNSKLHMVCDGLGRPLTFFLSPGQMSDAKGALVLLDALPPAKMLFGDKSYDADWFRETLEDKGIAACIPARRGRETPPATTGSSTSNVTRSRTCSPVSRTDAGSPPAITDAANSCSPPFASQPQSCSGCKS